jgi:hypothetical protein
MHRYPLLLAVLGLLAVAGGVNAQATVTFQQGVGGYTGTQDAELSEAEFPTTPMGDAPSITGDQKSGGGVAQGLLRFDNIFGTGANQIPLGSTINSATLQVNVTNQTPDGTLAFHRMLLNWSEATTTWSNFAGGNGVQPDGTDAVAAADITATPPNATGIRMYNVAASLRAWSGGAANLGWVITNTSGDGWDFNTSEIDPADLRPLLTVTWSPIPEPGTMLLASLGMGTLGLTGYRRWRKSGSGAP